MVGVVRAAVRWGGEGRGGGGGGLLPQVGGKVGEAYVCVCMCVCWWQREERNVAQRLRSDLCVPCGGHENGKGDRGVGEAREKYVGRIILSEGWHMSAIVRMLYAIWTLLIAR